MESGTKEVHPKHELEANPENEWAIPKLEPAISFSVPNPYEKPPGQQQQRSTVIQHFDSFTQQHHSLSQSAQSVLSPSASSSSAHFLASHPPPLLTPYPSSSSSDLLELDSRFTSAIPLPVHSLSDQPTPPALLSNSPSSAAYYHPSAIQHLPPSLPTTHQNLLLDDDKIHAYLPNYRFSDELFFNNLYAPLDVGFSSHDLSKIHPSITNFNTSHMPKYVSLNYYCSFRKFL
ncbi:hypothetical protein WR25_23394 [Diploscapter pachys]|uniref:Uncharacterized protein n=1 Tax=Diploscapter pachys TaxID=2018661 RepID=A0A2A2L5K2_9BILA|nr:hypothetical protein WR25_23394 [Diploscapter pachys]